MSLPLDRVTFADIQQAATHHFTESNGVRLHYASIGNGPLIVLLHGFPDHWLGWWHQIAGLSAHYQVVAMDMRGYNLSDRPEGVRAYDAERLVADVASVIEATGNESAIIVGHDWGGYVGWQLAMQAPHRVRGLAALSIPHPWAIARDLERNLAQRKASEYTVFFQQEDSHLKYPFERLGFWINDPAYLEVHMAAMRASNLNAMLHYYRANFPTPPYQMRTDAPPRISVPTLLLHGLKDPYSLPCGLNDVWDWIDADIEIDLYPDAGHFLHHEKRLQITQRLLSWVRRFD
jgi:pimeloyl-ACP methyl ester carboxylesterase